MNIEIKSMNKNSNNTKTHDGGIFILFFIMPVLLNYSLSKLYTNYSFIKGYRFVGDSHYL